MTRFTEAHVEEIINNFLDDTQVSQRCKEAILEYCANQSIHSVIEVTFKEIFVRVWNRITNYEEMLKKVKGRMASGSNSNNKGEVVKFNEGDTAEVNKDIGEVENIDGVEDTVKNMKMVLEQEMMDSECKCFTGRISRLVNCLNGFFPDIRINISDGEQMQAVIAQIRTDLDATKLKDGEHYGEILYARVKEAMEERGFSEEYSESWLEQIRADQNLNDDGKALDGEAEEEESEEEQQRQLQEAMAAVRKRQQELMEHALAVRVADEADAAGN
uniref:Uncharacterized protein n=1 Tax=viral metagenome TaxID=1070528 RepID=A0A6C0CML6_9ZZZZ